jgi:heme/copper-type cytochrome/quinol oxidase subunit 3
MEKNKLGMLLFIASESVFFLLLVIAYVVYHRESGNGARAADVLNTAKTGMFSLFLFASSATLWRSERARKRNRAGSMAAWLLVTIAFGLVFLAGQVWDYASLLREGVTISRDLFGTTFFTLTGFHGLHVFIGLVLLSVFLWMAWFGRKDEPRIPAMVAGAMYWHFVDAVWVVIFSVVYLWSAL